MPLAFPSDQFQLSLAASPEILHHTVWRTWLFIAYSDERIITTNAHYLTYAFSVSKKVGRMYFLNLGMKGLVELATPSKSLA